MSVYSSVVETAAAMATPTRSEVQRLERISEYVLVRARSAGSEFPEVKDVILGGSFAKGTWVPGHADLDVFVRIDVGTPEQRFEEVGLAVGTAATKGYPRGKKFAQHPYIEAIVEGVRVNIVPCYAVREKEWKSAADRSPYHVGVVSRLPDDMKREIRVLKLFMKAADVYGAEIEVRGFSGYAAEVLVIRHGDFRGVLRHFANLRAEENERLLSLPDPVDPLRELATAISGEKLGTMIMASREFLNAPSTAYFRRLSGRTRPSIKSRVIVVTFSHRATSEDVLWGELRRTLRHLTRHLELKGFKMARTLCASDNSKNSAFLLIPEYTDLPSLEQHVGPRVDRREDLDAFLTSNKRRARLVWVDDEAHVRLLRPREYTDIITVLRRATSGKDSVGASEGLVGAMHRTARVRPWSEHRKSGRVPEWLSRGVVEIVSDAVGTS